MLLVIQIDTFYDGLTLRHRDTINAADGGTFMKKRPEEYYNLIENMTAHHNHYDTSATRDETSRTISSTTTESPEVVRQLEMMNKKFQDMMRQIKSVKFVHTKCETYGGPHSYTEYPAVSGYTQEAAYATTGKVKTTTSATLDSTYFCFSPERSGTRTGVVLLKKLPEKHRDHGIFLIPCDFQGLESCMVLADLDASTNLMPLSVWKKLYLPDHTPTRMTLELATRSIAYPARIAEDVFVQVGKFTFLADFVVVDYDVNPRIPLIFGRTFLRTARALVDVLGEEPILRDGDEKLIFHADNTSKHRHKHGNESINMINSIDITCEDHFLETSDSLLEEFADELALLDPFPPINKDDSFDFEADLRKLNICCTKIHRLLNNDSTLPEESFEIATFSSSPFGNEDKVFNPGNGYSQKDKTKHGIGSREKTKPKAYSSLMSKLTNHYHWTKEHPLEQICGNPSNPVETKRQHAVDPEMCMFALTVSNTELKNIKEAMVDQEWIEAMQEELYQFDRLKVWKLDKPFRKTPEGFVDPGHLEKVYRIKKTLYGLKQAPRAWYVELSKFLLSKGFSKDTDHAGCLYTCKITSGGIQFLGDQLVSWMSKKQDCTVMSTIEAKYVALSASCAQVLWMRTQLKDYDLTTTKYHYIVTPSQPSPSHATLCNTPPPSISMSAIISKRNRLKME
nr:reverse transcriptase domain-containing protein [Tanacetum cinerariifolium]